MLFLLEYIFLYMLFKYKIHILNFYILIKNKDNNIQRYISEIESTYNTYFYVYVIDNLKKTHNQ